MAKLLASSGQGIYKINVVDTLRDAFERIIDVVSFLFFVFLALVGIYALVDAHHVEASAQLDSEVATIATEISEKPEHSFEELSQINPDIVAWLRIDDTAIDFPIVWTNKDNIKYLTRNYRGENATAGAAFIDYRNNGIEDYYTVIYGHRMSGDKMFSSITKFMDADFFNSHRTGIFFAPSATYDLEVILSARPNVSETQIYNMPLYRNASYATIYGLSGADILHQRNLTVEPNEKLLLLSTCDKDASHYRNVILLKMKKRGE
jgi:sortase B